MRPKTLRKMPNLENWIDDFLTDKPTESTHELIDTLDGLLQYASISEERKAILYQQIYSMNYEECIKLMVELQEKQIDRITGGLNYNMTEIINHLKKMKNV